MHVLNLLFQSEHEMAESCQPWSLFCAINAISVFSFTFSKQKTIPQSTYAFSFHPTFIQPSAFSAAFGLCVLSVPSLHGNLDVKLYLLAPLDNVYNNYSIHPWSVYHYHSYLASTDYWTMIMMSMAQLQIGIIIYTFITIHPWRELGDHIYGALMHSGDCYVDPAHKAVASCCVHKYFHYNPKSQSSVSSDPMQCLCM